MSFFLCKLWPYLAGGLIGWLLSGWLARKLKHVEPPKTIQKLVDNPDHLNRIRTLEKENAEIATLRTQITSLKSTSASSGGNDKYLSRIADLEKENSEIASLRSQIKSFDGKKATTVDNPIHIKRIADLEARLAKVDQVQGINIGAAKAAGIKVKADGDFEAIEGIGPKISGIIQNDGINTFSHLSDTSPAHIQTLLDNAGSRYNMANPGTWPDQANLAANNRWSALKALQDVLDGGVYPDASKSSDSGSQSSTTSNDNAKSSMRINELEKEIVRLKQSKSIDIKAAKTAGISIKSDGDFTAIEGIGPKINDLIHDDGIKTFGVLSDTSPNHIQKILDDAGPRYRMANPGTWPDQASLAANNRWGALKALQDVLDGGVYPDASKVSDSTTTETNKTSSTNSALTNEKASDEKTVDDAAAKSAGFKLKKDAKGYHDFTIVEGIGPKINGLIHDADIHFYSQLASSSSDKIQKILDDAGPRYSLADPGTWPEQAKLASESKWNELKKWQDELDGGKA